jgi:tol-pal system protein YbgF
MVRAVIRGPASIVGALAAAAFVLFPLAALAQGDTRALVERLDRIERDMNLLQRQVYRGTGSGGAPVAPSDPSQELNLQLRMEQIETQMRTLTGQQEEVSYQLDQLKRRIDKLVSDVDLRLSALEKGGAPAGESRTVAVAPAGRPGQPEPPHGANDPSRAPSTGGVLGTLPASPPGGTAPSQPPAQQAARPPADSGTLPAGTSQEQYNYAFGLLRQADYGGAETALKQFLQRYPNDPLAGNAQYWLGETYYVRKDYNNAAIAFAEGYRKYPNGGKGPDSLLKLGMSLAEVGQKPQACQALNQLEREYPKASANIGERAKAERQRLDCGKAR